jgi:transcriptional regulator with XRE-family HTH domain
MITTAKPSPRPTPMMILTPGAYIKYRRQAQLLSLEDVAARLDTAPHIPVRDRSEWLEHIECDIVPAGIETIDALHRVIRFDRSVLATLAAIARGERDLKHYPLLCRICACSYRDACSDGARGCAWVPGEDLCTACVASPAAAT